MFKFKLFLRGPTLGSLDGEEGEHGCWYVIVMKLLSFPKSWKNLWRKIVRCTEHKIFAPRENISLKNVS